MSRNDKYKDIASRLIKKYDERKNIVLAGVTRTYNASTYQYENTETTKIVRAIVSSVDAKVFDASSIQDGDIMLITEGFNASDIFDKATVDGDEYVIVKASPVKPISGDVIMQRYHCRG